MSKDLSEIAKYSLLGLLFVNISIGGTLTHFAAPPVLVVARVWHWDTPFMLSHFGWRVILAVFISTLVVTYLRREDLDKLELAEEQIKREPLWIMLVDMGFIVAAVFASHHVSLLVPVFLFFLGWTTVSSEYQDPLRLREGLLVGFFLGGLVTLGSLQSWWIKPFLGSLGTFTLFVSSTALTAVADNALLAYLGTLVPDFTEAQKVSLVSGAVCGGGLTVIANAPNPIGYTLLGTAFGEDKISASKLFLAAIGPTLFAAAMFLI